MSKTFNLTEQQVLENIIAHRRDIRGNNFLPTDIPQTLIDKVMQSAMLAPSVGLSQPWEFVFIRSADTKNRIAENHHLENDIAKAKFSDDKQKIYNQLKLEGIKEAPLNIAVFYTPSEETVLGQNSMAEMGEYSVVCAIQNMWLTARSLNLGLGWVSIINPEKVKEILNAPKTHKLVAYLCLGYVKEFLAIPELETLKWSKREKINVIDERYALQPSAKQ